VLSWLNGVVNFGGMVYLAGRDQCGGTHEARSTMYDPIFYTLLPMHSLMKGYTLHASPRRAMIHKPEAGCADQLTSAAKAWVPGNDRQPHPPIHHPACTEYIHDCMLHAEPNSETIRYPAAEAGKQAGRPPAHSSPSPHPYLAVSLNPQA
jgi:hypothetical protein